MNKYLIWTAMKVKSEWMHINVFIFWWCRFSGKKSLSSWLHSWNICLSPILPASLVVKCATIDDTQSTSWGTKLFEDIVLRLYPVSRFCVVNFCPFTTQMKRGSWLPRAFTKIFSTYVIQCCLKCPTNLSPRRRRCFYPKFAKGITYTLTIDPALLLWFNGFVMFWCFIPVTD